jgi:hypothetical protein
MKNEIHELSEKVLKAYNDWAQAKPSIDKDMLAEEFRKAKKAHRDAVALIEELVIDYDTALVHWDALALDIEVANSNNNKALA